MIKKILVSQPKPSSEKSPYYEIASKYGVELVFRPFIKVRGFSKRIPPAKDLHFRSYSYCIYFASRH